MELFKGQNLLEFAERFSSDESCIEYLAYNKWSKDLCVENADTPLVKQGNAIRGLVISVATQNRQQQTRYFIQ